MFQFPKLSVLSVVIDRLVIRESESSLSRVCDRGFFFFFFKICVLIISRKMAATSCRGCETFIMASNITFRRTFAFDRRNVNVR